MESYLKPAAKSGSAPGSVLQSPTPTDVGERMIRSGAAAPGFDRAQFVLAHGREPDHGKLVQPMLGSHAFVPLAQLQIAQRLRVSAGVHQRSVISMPASMGSDIVNKRSASALSRLIPASLSRSSGSHQVNMRPLRAGMPRHGWRCSRSDSARSSVPGSHSAGAPAPRSVSHARQMMRAAVGPGTMMPCAACQFFDSKPAITAPGPAPSGTPHRAIRRSLTRLAGFVAHPRLPKAPMLPGVPRGRCFARRCQDSTPGCRPPARRCTRCGCSIGAVGRLQANVEMRGAVDHDRGEIRLRRRAGRHIHRILARSPGVQEI